MNRKKRIAIFGSSMIRPGDADYQKAEELGSLLAQAGYSICNGGYMGSMEASAKGASESGAEVIGVTCQDFASRTPCPYLTEERMQPGLIKRIETMIQIADAYIVLGGGIGTLAELFVVWNLLAIDSIPKRPLLLYGDHYGQLMKVLEELTEIRPKHLACLKVVSSAEEILELLPQ